MQRNPNVLPRASLPFQSAIHPRLCTLDIPQRAAPWPQAALAAPAARILLMAATQLGDTHAPDLCCQVVPRQPQPASMSPSSQYYRTASHYQNLPASNHGQLYALATPWPDDPAHDSYATAPSPSPGPFLHYTQAGSDCASLLHSSAPLAWPPSWHEHAFTAPDAAPYSHADDPTTSRPYQPHQHQHQHQHESPQEKSHSPANAVDPPFLNHAPKPHAVSPLSLSPSHTTPQVQPHSQTPWEPYRQIPRHATNTVPSTVTTARQNTPSATPWPPIVSGESLVATAIYGRLPNVDPEWPLVQAAQSERGAYSHQQASVDPFDHASAQLARYQRPQTKKKATKVPSSFVERQEKLKVSKRKGPLQEKLREKTHTMRKNKRICVRCRFYKSGCDEGDPCQKCDKITGHARSFREPCYREHLEDTSLVRRCNGREHQEEAEFLGYDWVHNSQLYEMEILWNLPGYGPIPNARPMRITFRPYSPRRGSLDVAASVWSNRQGEVRQLEQPAYAIYDTANLVPAFERYFSSLQPAIEEWIFARIRQDEVAFLTYQEVIRMRTMKGSKALDLAMRIQCLSVVSQGYGSVWSNNIPGIREYDYRNMGRSDYEAYDRNSRDRPLPGAMTHQMDVAAVKYLGKLEKAFVKELAALIFKPKIKPWYELFLAFYVIFWNLDYIHHGAQDYIKSKNGTLIENQVSNVVTTQIKKWEFAFPVLLYHWRCTLRGYSPFKLARDNPEELCEKGHIDPEGFQYVTKISNVFDRVNPDRFQPPLTGFAATHWSTSSEWIVKLFKEAGA